MSDKKTIMIVDDDTSMIEVYGMYLMSTDFTIIIAMTIEELFDKYEQNRHDIAGIILDGCLHTNRYPDTMPFVERIAADRAAGLFDGVVLAASSDPGYRKAMVEAGCTRETEKHRAAKDLIALITA